MRKTSWNTFQVKKILCTLVIHVLDFFLFMILLPFTIWEWFSKRNHLLAMLRATFEIALELSMWIILAGMSLLCAVAFTLDDMYRSKTESKCERKYSRASTPDKDDNEHSSNANLPSTAKKRKIFESI